MAGLRGLSSELSTLSDVKSTKFSCRFPDVHLASFYGQVEVACMLIEYGADVAARNKDGQSPLHLATPTYWIKKSRKCAEVARIQYFSIMAQI